MLDPTQLNALWLHKLAVTLEWCPHLTHALWLILWTLVAIITTIWSTSLRNASVVSTLPLDTVPIQDKLNSQRTFRVSSLSTTFLIAIRLIGITWEPKLNLAAWVLKSPLRQPSQSPSTIPNGPSSKTTKPRSASSRSIRTASKTCLTPISLHTFYCR